VNKQFGSNTFEHVHQQRSSQNIKDVFKQTQLSCLLYYAKQNVCVCVCVCVCVSERERESVCECVCVCECMCVCIYIFLCLFESEIGRERGWVDGWLKMLAASVCECVWVCVNFLGMNKNMSNVYPIFKLRSTFHITKFS